MQVASVSASFRHGITIETSGAPVAVGSLMGSAVVSDVVMAGTVDWLGNWLDGAAGLIGTRALGRAC